MQTLEKILRSTDKILYYGLIFYILLTIFDIIRYKLGFVRGFPKEYLTDINLLISDAAYGAFAMFAVYGVNTIILAGVELYNIKKSKNK